MATSFDAAFPPVLVPAASWSPCLTAPAPGRTVPLIPLSSSPRYSARSNADFSWIFQDSHLFIVWTSILNTGRLFTLFVIGNHPNPPSSTIMLNFNLDIA